MFFIPFHHLIWGHCLVNSMFAFFSVNWNVARPAANGLPVNDGQKSSQNWNGHAVYYCESGNICTTFSRFSRRNIIIFGANIHDTHVYLSMEQYFWISNKKNEWICSTIGYNCKNWRSRSFMPEKVTTLKCYSTIPPPPWFYTWLFYFLQTVTFLIHYFQQKLCLYVLNICQELPGNLIYKYH